MLVVGAKTNRTCFTHGSVLTEGYIRRIRDCGVEVKVFVNDSEQFKAT